MVNCLRRIPSSECDTRDIGKHFFVKILILFTFLNFFQENFFQFINFPISLSKRTQQGIKKLTNTDIFIQTGIFHQRTS